MARKQIEAAAKDYLLSAVPLLMRHVTVSNVLVSGALSHSRLATDVGTP